MSTPSPAAVILIAPIRFYQRFISRYTPPSCRYYPCCSSYAITALRTHGAVVGTGLTIWRLLRCNPWSDGGVDHVPPKGQLTRRGRERAAAAGSSQAGPLRSRAADVPSNPPVLSTPGPATDPPPLALDLTPGRSAA